MTDTAHRRMRILIVDDEPPARARLASLIAELGIGEVVGEAGNGQQALTQVERCAAEVVLLDIRMPGMDGIEVARRLAQLEQPPAVIFTTAYDSHALAAIQASAVDYLLKPIRRERLAEALVRSRSLTRAQMSGLAVAGDEDDTAEDGARTHVSATLHGDLRRVPVDDVRYFRADHKYVVARYPGGELLLEDSLVTLEQEFGTRFLRVHRNALVAVAHVRAMERDLQGHQIVRLDGIDEGVEVSRRLAAAVRRRLAGTPGVAGSRGPD